MRIPRQHGTSFVGTDRDPRPAMARVAVAGLVLAVVASGCSSVRKAIVNANNSAASYNDLQGFIKDQLTTKFDRSVRSVSCTPHVQQVLPGDTANLTCVVVFTDGTSYTTPASITDPSTDPDIATESFSFNDPPDIDITTAPLPSPAVTLAATSPGRCSPRATWPPW